MELFKVVPVKRNSGRAFCITPETMSAEKRSDQCALMAAEETISSDVQEAFPYKAWSLLHL